MMPFQNTYRILLLLLVLFLNSSSVTAKVYINELVASNNTGLVDASDYLAYSDWIELYNDGSAVVDLGGYFLTDDLDNPTKWSIPQGVTIPSNGFVLFWADGKDKRPGETDILVFTDSITITIEDHHLSFGLSSTGEAVGLFRPDRQVEDSVSFGMQAGDVSYGRNPNNLNQWRYFGAPTPLAANSTTGSPVYQISSAPMLQLEAGFYNGSQSLAIIHPSPTAKIYYTTDGSKPDETASLYTNPIPINYTQVVKVVVVEGEQLPSPVQTRTYFIDESSNLPVVAISTDQDNLWSFDYGIYKNSFKDREIPASIELFNDSLAFQLDAGIELFGSNIFDLQQKPFSIAMKNKYGEETLAYQLFQGKDIYQFKNFVLRNGGNDNGITFFRDAMVTSLVAGQLDIDYQAYQPAVLFLNGEFWGLYNIREKMNRYYVAGNHNRPPDNLDILEDNAAVMEGDAQNYLALIDYIASHDLADSAHYQYVASQMDINEYLNYKITKTYIGYWIEDVNNKYWREKVAGSQWRWMLFDLEHGFGRNGSDTCGGNTLEKVSTAYPEMPDWSTLLFRKLCDNSTFREALIQRSASMLNTLFQPDRVIEMIDSLQTLYTPQMSRHITRWENDPMAIPSMQAWNTQVEAMREYARCRPDQMRQHIMERFGVQDTFRVTIRIPGADTGKVYINDIQVRDSLFEGVYFSGAPLRLKAVANYGYNSLGWDEIASSDTVTIWLNMDTILKPLFEATTTANLLPRHFTTDTTLSGSIVPYVATGDLIIDSNVTLTLEAGAEIRLPDKANFIVYGALVSNGAAANPVVLRVDPQPNARRPHYNPDPRWGALCVHQATDTSKLQHTLLVNTSTGFEPSLHVAAVSGYQSNLILDKVGIEDALQPIHIRYGSAVVRNCSLTTKLTGDVINIKYADSAVVERCVIIGNDAEDTDGIDFDGISMGVIRNNKVSGFFGFNSDGIDLGEGCQNILIEGNEIKNCTDKGISVGQASTAVVRRNLIVNCAQGLGIKDSLVHVLIDQNTLYGNDYNVAVFEKNLGAGGGSATVRNTILANGRLQTYLKDQFSTIDITYSLSNTIPMEGEGNLYAEPEFADAGRHNFELLLSSPCIDSGDPNSPKDPDSSRADMGAYWTFMGDSSQKIVINEINYNSLNTLESGDWVELYNGGIDTADLSGWILTDNNLEHTFVFPSGIRIAPAGFLIVGNDSVAFRSQFGGAIAFVGNFSFGIDGNDEINLFDADRQTVSAMAYGSLWPWPDQPNGRGVSLELSSPGLDFTLPGNWHESYVTGGTPGFPNSTAKLVEEVFINEFMADNRGVLMDSVGEYDDWIELYNGSGKAVDLAGLYLTDDLSNPTKWQFARDETSQTVMEPGSFLLVWADEQEAQGPLHTNFKLASEGEVIALVQVIGGDTLWVDSIVFGVQLGDYPFGRYPDGAEDWRVLYPTPDTSNRLLEPISFDGLVVYPNPTDGKVYFQLDGIVEEVIEVEVLNGMGQVVVREELVFGFEDGVKELDLEGLGKGLYVFRLRWKGLVEVGKVVVY